MNNGAARTISLQLFVAFVMLSTPWARASDTPEPTMGPVDPYLMADPNAEVALARSAAPPSISADASGLVLTRDGSGPGGPHLMFYVPQMDTAAWGSDQPGTPVFLNSQFNGAPEPVTVFMVVVNKWSDGTPLNVTKHEH